MARSRTDEVLEGWKMVAHIASRPAVAPRPRTRRTSGPSGLVPAAAVVLLLVVALSVRGLGQGPTPSQPAVGATPSMAASPVATANPSPSLSPTDMPTPSVAPGGSSTSADITTAKAAVDQYSADLVRGDYAAAWAMLGPEYRANAAPFASWSSERSQFFKSVAGRYTVVVSPPGVAPITDWLSSTFGAPINLAHAVLVEVDYPALAGNNAGYNLYIVNRTASGLAIYVVR